MKNLLSNRSKLTPAGLMLACLLVSGSVFAVDSTRELCEPDVSKVTPHADGSFTVCNTTPAVHITHAQAKEIALVSNAQQADLLCPSGHRGIGQPAVVSHRFAVTVLTKFACL